MPASSTDVRQWAREQGHDVPARGAVPQHLREAYDQAHPAAPVIPGEVIRDDPNHPDLTLGVTEADFPPDADYDESAQDSPQNEAQNKKTRERKPRAVKPPKPAGIRERIFSRKTAGRPKARHPRQSLSDWAEETWEDLAWLAQPVPPLAKILTLQAPYAGVVFDDAVKGTVVESVLQPVARYSSTFRALNGLAGPPVYVAMICAMGQRVQVARPDGKPLLDESGQPVMAYDTRTQMLFQGLRYSLLQMTKISEVNADQIRERAQASAERQATVDALIESIFEMPQFSPPVPAHAAAGAGGGPSANGYRYPDPPTMDGTGADPNRMM